MSRAGAFEAADAALSEQLVKVTGHWSAEDRDRADALREAGDPRAQRVQTWTFDQGLVWVNMMGRVIELSEMDESYLLNVIAFLHSNAARFARVWVQDHLNSRDPDSDFRGLRVIDYDRLQLAAKEPHRFMAQSQLMCALWAEVFKRRGRMNGIEDSGEDL